MERIFLVGYMGAGKTTLGRKLAQALRFSFVDLDVFIEERFHRTVSALFSERGEAWFRETERRLLHEVGDFDRVVIATGGGTPCFFDNADYMSRQGITVYLRAEPDTLVRRLFSVKHSRPLLRNKDEEELSVFVRHTLAERRHAYERADLVVDTGEMNTPESIRRAENLLISCISDYKGPEKGAGI